MLKEKKYTAIIQTKGSGGTKTTTRELPAFNIVELEPLTQKELDALAAKQSSAGLVVRMTNLLASLQLEQTTLGGVPLDTRTSPK